jgi:hypothetical protein
LHFHRDIAKAPCTKGPIALKGDEWAKTAGSSDTAVGYGSVIGEAELSLVLYADDAAFVVESKEDLQAAAEVTYDHCKERK